MDNLLKCICGSQCIYQYRENEPCWGDITVSDEIYDGNDWSWIHVCSGHYEVWDGGNYIQKKKV